MLKLFNRYRDQYPQILSLALPVILSQVGQVTVQIADNAMVGHLGTTPLAAVSLGGSVFFLFFIIGIGISLGITPLVGEMFVKGEHRISAKYLQNSVLLYGIIGVALFVGTQLFIPFMYKLKQPQNVVDLAIPFYKYICWSIIPFMLFSAFKQFLEGLGSTKIAMVIIIAANVLNIILNYVLIYGKFGFPDMGAAGAGLSTLISRVVMFVGIAGVFLFKSRFKRYLSFFRWSNFDFKVLGALMLVGTPIALQVFMEGGVFAVTSVMMGWIGEVEMAANQVAMSISSFAFMILIGLSSATTIRVSHFYGNRDFETMRRSVNATYIMGLIYNCITATLFISFRDYIPLVFTSDPAVISLASKLLFFVGLFQIADGLQIISVGALRGLKDVKHVMIIAFISYIVVNLPIGYYLAFNIGWEEYGIWTGLIVGLSLAAVLLYLRWRKLFKLLSQKSGEICQ